MWFITEVKRLAAGSIKKKKKKNIDNRKKDENKRGSILETQKIRKQQGIS